MSIGATKRHNTDKSKLLVSPAILLVALITQVPFIVTIVLSLIRWNIRRPDIPIRFIGLKNFQFIFSDKDFFSVLRNSAILTTLSLAFCLVLGFLFALLYNRRFKGISIARSLLILPYFIMEPIIGIVWKTLILSPSFGLNQVISSVFGMEPISFFSSDNSLITIIILVIWQWTPFFFMILLSGLQNMPVEILESARIDGASAIKVILYIKLPLLKNYIEVAVMFGLINILKVFGLIFVTTQGGPGVSSANLPYYVYRTAFYDWQVGRSAAIAVIMVLITLILIRIFNMVGRKNQVQAHDKGGEEL